MVYWWTLLPPWTILLFFMMLNSLFQILAFQPPAPKKIGTNERTTQIAQTRRATSRCSVSAAYLNDVVRNITKGKGGVGEIEERMRRASGVHARRDGAHFFVSLSKAHMTLFRQSLQRWCLSVQCCQSLSCSSSALTVHILALFAVDISAHMSSHRSAELNMCRLFACIGHLLSRFSGWQFFSHSCRGNLAHASSRASGEDRPSRRT